MANGKDTSLRALMVFTGISGSSIARSLKMHRSSINKVITGQSTSPRARKAVADALGLKASALWQDMKEKT
jgi:lambda repressor-like predicted transcriptional regulator